MSTAVGVVDCGTNSTRLLVAGPGASTLDRRMVITRLGQGVDRTRRLSEEAMARTLAVLRDYRAVMEANGVSRRRAVATSAARDAGNREEFFDRAAEVLGARPELLSGQEEGRLSFAGATASLGQASGPVLVADIGGGSTELVVGMVGSPDVAAVSLQLGCVRLSERFLRHDPPRPEELAAARSHVISALDGARASLPELGSAELLVGLAGTVSTTAMIDLGSTAYRRDDVHHHVLSDLRVREILDRLAGLDHDRRSACPGLEAGRVDVIVGGLVVLAGVMDHLGFGACLVSESDILDGLAAELLAAA